MDNTYEDWCDFDNLLDISEELEEIIYGKCYSIIDSEGRFAFGPIYHYSYPEGLLGILRDKNPTLWFTRYDSLNDYSERGHIFDCIRTYCDNGVKKGVLHPGFSDFVKNIKPVEECLFAYESKYTNTENGEEHFGRVLVWQYRNNTKLISGTISLHGMRKAPTVSDRRFV